MSSPRRRVEALEGVEHPSSRYAGLQLVALLNGDKVAARNYLGKYWVTVRAELGEVEYRERMRWEAERVRRFRAHLVEMEKILNE